jgi:queuine tRNA-ribosyltransferase
MDARARGPRARAARFHTLRGEVLTPVFMPVGTQATVRGLSVDDLRAAGSTVLLANAYHLLLRPGLEVFERLGGIHRFMQWDGSVLTDSGGFQVFSLAEDRAITEEGAVFRSYVDGRRIVLSPERSIGVQQAIGSDIMMAMDHCIASTADHATASAAVHLTRRWAARSLAARGDSPRALFGIVQGACFEDLRRESAEGLTRLPFDGFGIGGLAVGESKALRERFTELTTDLLPNDLPRYLMGVGTPADLLEAVHRGVDMFDCSIPSALAKQGVAFTSRGRLNLHRGVYKVSEERVDPECGCTTCGRYSRAYLHHLTKAGELLGWQLLTKHNLHFYHALTATMRRHIVADTFTAYYEAQRDVLMRGDDEYPSRPPTVRRARRDPQALERFEVRESPHGYASIVHRRSGEIMHAGLDPSAEAQALYVDQSRLAERLREPGPEPLGVWDVGLGAAHNAMAVLHCRYMCDGTARRPLRLVSFEHDLGSLRLALRNATRFPHLHRAGPNDILRSGEWRSPEEAVVWTLLEGDFLARLPEAPPPDLIFYDPFSAKTDTAMWTLECFDRLFGACGERDTELFTYSASTAVRAALLAAGFVVGRGVPTGSRSETTVALTPLAALRSAARGRVLLGTEWLERWRRSHTRVPSDVPADDHAFAERIVGHAQFQGTREPA